MKNGLDVEEFSEFTKEMVKYAEKQMPKTCRKFMRTEAKKLVAEAKKIAQLKVNKKTGNYLKGFKAGKKVYKYQDADYNIVVSNDAPHAHLLEEGHKMTKHGGRKMGRYRRGSAPAADGKQYIPGRFILRTAAEQFEKEYASDIENELVEDIVKEIEKG